MFHRWLNTCERCGASYSTIDVAHVCAGVVPPFRDSRAGVSIANAAAGLERAGRLLRGEEPLPDENGLVWPIIDESLLDAQKERPSEEGPIA